MQANALPSEPLRRSARGYGDGKIEVASDLAVPPLGTHLEKTPVLKDMCPNVHCNTIYNS